MTEKEIKDHQTILNIEARLLIAEQTMDDIIVALEEIRKELSLYYYSIKPI